METKIIMPKDLCEEEAIRFVARRYNTTPEEVLSHYLKQTGVVGPDCSTTVDDYELTTNELALLCDLGARPSKIEIK